LVRIVCAQQLNAEFGQKASIGSARRRGPWAVISYLHQGHKPTLTPVGATTIARHSSVDTMAGDETTPEPDYDSSGVPSFEFVREKIERRHGAAQGAGEDDDRRAAVHPDA
jgi:hypothetical protein